MFKKYSMRMIILLLVALLMILANGRGSSAYEEDRTIRGQIICTQPVKGKIHLLALQRSQGILFNLRRMETKPEVLKSKTIVAYASLDRPGPFTIGPLSPGVYALYAWVDVNGNGAIEHYQYAEPTGWYQREDELILAGVMPGASNVKINVFSPRPYPDKTLKVERNSGGGILKEFKGFPLLILRGTLEERAYSQGYLLGPQIVDWIDGVVLEFFIGSISVYEKDVLPFLRKHFGGMKGYDSAFEMMLQGMRDRGSGLTSRLLNRDVTVDDLKAANAYYAMQKYISRDKHTSYEDSVKSLCSAAAVWGELTEGPELSGSLIHGKNMDGEIDLRKITVNGALIIAEEPAEGGKKFISIDWAPFLGRFNPMNEDGLSLLPHASESILNAKATNLTAHALRYREVIENCATINEAIVFWGKADRTSRLCGGFNTAISEPYKPGTNVPPAVTIESDSYGFAVRGPMDFEPKSPHSIITTNNFFLYQGERPEAVRRAGGYHSTVLPRNHRYRDIMKLIETYDLENTPVGSAEMINLLRAASTSEQYQGMTEYSFISYPNEKAFAVAKEDLRQKILDASFSRFTSFTFEEIFKEEKDDSAHKSSHNDQRAVYNSDRGTRLKAYFDKTSHTVTVSLTSGREVTLPLAVSASGARYSNDRETFWEHHGEASYWINEELVFRGKVELPK